MSADWSLTVHADAMITSSLSGSVTWVGSSGIWVGSAHPGEEDAWRRVGACGHVPLQNFTPFLPVCLSFPPLHSGMVKTPF